MTQATVLYTSGDVHREVHKLLAHSNAGRRVVLAAYVGPQGPNYIPRPEGLELVCAPVPGVTSARAIRDLVTRGAKVRFSNKLHMKVYWSENQGCVITSANVSQSAMGANGLREAGVLLPSSQVDIERLLRAAKPRRRTSADMDLLDRTPVPTTPGSQSTGPNDDFYDFDAWFDSPSRQKWKMSWWDPDYDARISEAGTAWMKETYGSSASDPDILLHKKGQLAVGDWVLTYWKEGSRIGPPVWMYVNHVHRVPKNDAQFEPYYPFEALQTLPTRLCPTPPFRITPAFRRAFKSAAHDYGVERLYIDELTPPPKFLATLLAETRPDRNARSRRK